MKNECMTCNGTGEIRFTFNGKPDTLDCFSCEATGEVSIETRKEQEWEREMWCTCGYTGSPVRYEDYEHEDLEKHHYRCKKCDGVVQIG